MDGQEVVIGPLMGLKRAQDEIARRALVTEPKTPRDTPEDRVVAELDKLTAEETCCILGALRNHLGRDLPLTQIYELSVRSIVERYQEMADAPS
jgi:hypothetical protein